MTSLHHAVLATASQGQRDFSVGGQQKMELMCLTMWKRAFRGGYNFVRASEVVTQKLKQKHPNKERGKVRQLLTAEVVQKLYRRFNTLS